MIVCDMCHQPDKNGLFNFDSTWGRWIKHFDLCNKCTNLVIEFIEKK